MIETFKEFLSDVPAKNMFITGSAGTGKTTCIADLVHYCKANRLTYTVCAYTNKAVDVLDSKLPKGSNTSTLHKYLNKAPTVNEEAIKLAHVDSSVKFAPTNITSIVIIDEFSMIGSRDYKDLVDEQTSAATKVVYVGDKNQLPPVKDVNTIEPNGNYCINLTKIHRQKDGNKLLPVLLKLSNAIEADVSTADNDPVESLKTNANFKRNTDIVKKYLECKKDKKLLCFTNLAVQTLNCEIQGYKTPKIGDQLFNSKIKTTCTILEYIDKKDVTYFSNCSNDIVDAKTKFNPLKYAVDIPNIKFALVEEASVKEPDKTITLVRAFIFGTSSYAKLAALYKSAAVKTNKAIVAKVGVEVTGNISQWCNENSNASNSIARRTAWRNHYILDNNVMSIDFNHAMTIHKSQGSTYNTVFIDLEDVTICRSRNYKTYIKLVYVAMSRSSNMVYVNN